VQWVTVDAVSDGDDDMWLGHTKRHSRTQVYAGRKVRYVTGAMSIFGVASLQLCFSVLITV